MRPQEHTYTHHYTKGLMNTEQREDMVSQIMDITPTKDSLNAIEILDGMPDKALMNLFNEVSEPHGQQVWRSILELLPA